MVRRALIWDLTADGHLALSLTLASIYSRDQGLLKDEKPLTTKADSYPKTSTRPVCSQIDAAID